MAATSTRNHGAIRTWARAHGALPAIVSRAAGMLRFEFPDAPSKAPSRLDWREFFQVLDEKGLELIYDDQPGSRLHKFAYPETVAAQKPARAPSAAKKARPKPRSAWPRRRVA